MQGLNDNVTLDNLADFFKQCGVVKMNKRTGQPIIDIYLDEETGKPKGDATVSYEDPPTAKAAVEWFDGKGFQGSKLKVSLARKKSPMNSMSGEEGMPPHEGRRMPPPHRGGPGGPGGSGGPIDSIGGRGETEEASPQESPRLQREPFWRRKCPAPSWRLPVSQSGLWKPELRLENRMQPV